MHDIDVILNFGRADNFTVCDGFILSQQVNILNKYADDNSLILDMCNTDIETFEGKEFTIQYSAEAKEVLDLDKFFKYDNSAKYNFIKNFNELKKYFILFYRQMDKQEICSMLDSVLYSNITEEEIKNAQRFSRIFMSELVKEKGEIK